MHSRTGGTPLPNESDERTQTFAKLFPGIFALKKVAVIPVFIEDEDLLCDILCEAYLDTTTLT